MAAPDDNRNLQMDDNANVHDSSTLCDDSEHDGSFRNEGVIVRAHRILARHTYTLEYIKNVLRSGMHEYFNEFEIDVVSCPCLTMPPYNLLAAGLSGNTMAFMVGKENNAIKLRTYKQYNIRRILMEHCYDSFIIGTGFTAGPNMPCNGYLTMNASISSGRNVVNDSHIVYEKDNNHSHKLELLSAPNQMCCTYGNFFVSEGRSGMVIKVRAKERKTEFDFVTSIQKCLVRCSLFNLILGGVLKINGGHILQHVICQNYPVRFRDYPHFVTSGQLYITECNDLIAVGTIGNEFYIPPRIIQYFTGYESRFKFNTISNDRMGQYFNDLTPNETEYIGYFNVAKKNFYF